MMPEESTGNPVTVVVVVDVAAGSAAAFREYESLVLPMLGRHGGVLERRVRDSAGGFEAHLVRFGNRAGYEAYMGDPARAVHRRLLDGLDLRQRLVEVHDVPAEESGIA